VAEDRAIARGKQGGEEATVLGKQFRRDGRVDARVKAMKAAGAERPIDRRGRRDPRREELRPRDDAS
jgi:hypothetical protein